MIKLIGLMLVITIIMIVAGVILGLDENNKNDKNNKSGGLKK